MLNNSNSRFNWEQCCTEFILGLLVVAVLTPSLFVTPVSGSDWWDLNWSRRVKITFDNSAISENLTNFPMPIVIDGGEIYFWYDVSSDGSDIRFVDTDDSTELYFELEQWDYSGNNMVAWVKVPQVDASSSTDFIWMYYGYSGASFDSYYNSAQVWSNNYVAVWHLNNTWNDATSNNHDGTITGTVTYDSSGKVAGCYEFEGSSDYVTVSDTSALRLTSTDFAIELWVNHDTLDADWLDELIGKGESEQGKGWQFALTGIKDSDPDGRLRFGDGGWYGRVGGYDVDATALDQWEYVTVTYNSTSCGFPFYINGADAGNGTGADPYSSDSILDSTGLDVIIGTDPRDESGYDYDGWMDEIRISNTYRSAEWIEACYQYQVDKSKIQLERGPKPTLKMSPDSVTCRKFCENFTITINVSKVVNVEDFEFGIYYNATLLDYLNVTWNAWGSGTIYDNSTRGILIGDTSGSPATGNLTLATITFHAAYHHIWHSGDCENWKNNLAGTIYFQWANLGYPDVPDRRYEKDGPTEINVDPEEVAYIFSPIKGDVDNDGFVRIIDVRAVAAYYDVTYLDAKWAEASAYDLNCDQIVDLLDLVTVCGNYGYKYDS